MKHIVIAVGLLLSLVSVNAPDAAAFKVSPWTKELKKAQDLFAAKDYLGAARTYEKVAQQLKPDVSFRAKVLFNAALAYQNAGVRDKARDLFTLLVEQHPKDSVAGSALFSLAQLHLLLADHSAASKLLLRLDAQYPKSKDARDALLEGAVLLEAMGRKSEAAAALARWAKKYGRHATMGPRVALHRCTLMRRSATCYAKWLKWHRDAPFETWVRASLGLADAQKAAGRSKKAVKGLERVLTTARRLGDRSPWVAEARLRLARWEAKGHTLCDVLTTKHAGAAAEALAELALGKGTGCLRPGADSKLLLSKLRGRVGWVSAPTLRRLQKAFPEDFADIEPRTYVRSPSAAGPLTGFRR